MVVLGLVLQVLLDEGVLLLLVCLEVGEAAHGGLDARLLAKRLLSRLVSGEW